MVLDQVANFVRVNVSGSHTSGNSTISLQSGEASELPDTSNGKYNLVWYDSQNYQIPDKDPNVEIVRVNSIDTANDTISVTRGREDTSATAKDVTDAEYQLLLSLTAKIIQEIDDFKLDSSSYSPETDTHDKYTDTEAIDAVGASTPFANSDLSNSSVTIEGNSVSLGNSTSVNHNDLSSISSDDHHSKTSSASELTDVSPDSTTDAHHSKYTDSDATSAVGASTPFANSDLSNSSITINGTSVSLGGSTTVSPDLTTNNFEIVENSSTNSLNFNYTG